MATKKHKKTPAPKKPRAKSSKPAIEQPTTLPVPAEEPRKSGRPTVYTEALGQAICEELAEGKTLTAVCASNESFPEPRTIRRWALDSGHPFCPLYTRAREIGFHAMHDGIVDTANNTTTDPGQVARDRLKVDTGKWVLSKMLPRIYGDKLALTDPEGGKLTVQVVRLSDANN